MADRIQWESGGPVAQATAMAGQALELFHPLVRRWFAQRFAAPTDAQTRAWPIIARGEHVLVSAPTGSGKTLTAFLSALDNLITGRWPLGGVRALYLSPLKALNSDVRLNLLGPLLRLLPGQQESNLTLPSRRGTCPGNPGSLGHRGDGSASVNVALSHPVQKAGCRSGDA